jgi:predicted transcriptional regulator
MARASRSNKKHPDFDPSELEDLIFSPAVGKGVGSHLVTQRPAPDISSDLSTVPRKRPAHLTTVDRSQEKPVMLPPAEVVSPPLPETASDEPRRNLWITEHGDVISAARVKRIRLAQDAINSAEECVYDTLWNAKLLQTDERQSARIVQAGYDYLVKRTRLARKTIQRIVAKLIDKDFIEVETRADIYQRASTIYRVFSYKAVLERNIRKGRLYVAKMGPGFAYAKPIDEAGETAGQAVAEAADLTTVVMSDVTTMVETNMTTMVPETTVTVVKNNPTTVVKMSPYLLDTDVLDNTSSSGHRVREALLKFGLVDDDVVKQFVEACRDKAPDATEEEMVSFIEEKGSLIRAKESRVYNPIGFLMTAVPKCFSGETLRSYRERRDRQQNLEEARGWEEQASVDRWRREQEASLSDPNISEQEKHLIRLCLGLNTE